MMEKSNNQFKKNLPAVLVVLFLIVLIPITLTMVGNITNFFGRAATVGEVIPADGTLSGNVVSEIDPDTGESVVRFTQPVQSDFQPSAPFYATFFYIWYKNPNTDQSWSYWTDHGNNPPKTWFSHYLPDPNPQAFDPINELYSANDYDIFKWQVSKLAEAKQEVAIASWWGQGTKEDTAINNIINDYMARSDNPYPNLRWAMYYEDEGFSDPSVATLVDDLTHIKNKYAQSQYFLKIDGKPVIFVYGDSADGPGTVLQRWNDANTQLNKYFYVVLKVFSGYASSSPQPDSWHQYAPANRSGQHSSYSYYVSPGFWLDDGSAERLPRNSQEFETAVQYMASANTTWKIVETWNEWGEGSSVEPGEQTTKDSNGNEVIKQDGYQFKNLYIDILNRNLPALEAGTGR